MTTGIEMLKLPKERTVRGPSKKPLLVATSLRLPEDVMSFFNARYPYAKQAMMRQVLTDYVNNQAGTKP